MNMEKLTNVYLKIREERSRIKKEYEDRDVELKKQLAQIEGHMLKFLNENGMESSKTSVGTFFKQENVNPIGRDWQAIYEWITENKAFEALQRRINTKFVKEYMEDNDGALPPGVDIHREYVVRVRKS